MDMMIFTMVWLLRMPKSINLMKFSNLGNQREPLFYQKKYKLDVLLIANNS
jgi:hypothetical protein